jgi:hypothetical protein
MEYLILINGEALDKFGEMNPDFSEAQTFSCVEDAISYLMDCELDLEVEKIEIILKK